MTFSARRPGGWSERQGSRRGWQPTSSTRRRSPGCRVGGPSPAPRAPLDLVRLEPRGVVGVITPWNDPYPAAAGLVAAALVTGNVVVHKPSERSAAPGRRLTELIADCLPAGVLEVLEGDAGAGAALARHGGVDMVAHIGSSGAGASVRRACAQRGAACVTENGGKDALLVDDGVDPAWAAEQVAIGAFTNAGQLCTSVERVYVHEAVADAVLEGLVERAEALVVGDPREPHLDDGAARGRASPRDGRRARPAGPRPRRPAAHRRPACSPAAARHTPRRCSWAAPTTCSS